MHLQLFKATCQRCLFIFRLIEKDIIVPISCLFALSSSFITILKYFNSETLVVQSYLGKITILLSEPFCFQRQLITEYDYTHLSYNSHVESSTVTRRHSFTTIAIGRIECMRHHWHDASVEWLIRLVRWASQETILYLYAKYSSSSLTFIIQNTIIMHAFILIRFCRSVLILILYSCH